MKDSFEAYEAPNEYDQSHDEHWIATLNSFPVRLNRIVKSDPATTPFPVIGPSLTGPESLVSLRGPCLFDYANLHNYFAGRNPGTVGRGADGLRQHIPESIECERSLSRKVGYYDRNWLPNRRGRGAEYSGGGRRKVCATSLFGTMAARHSSNLPVRIDQLSDLPSGRPATDSAFGLLRQDYSAKPAYSALRNLLHLLSDPGPPFVGQELGFELAGDLSDLHHLLLQKRNGVFYLLSHPMARETVFV